MTHTCTCTQNSYMVIISSICGKWQQRPTEQLSVFRTMYIIALLEKHIILFLVLFKKVLVSH